MSQQSHKFSSLDVIIPPLYQAFVYCFPVDNARQRRVEHILREGWAKTLVAVPVLKDEICYDELPEARPGSLTIRSSPASEDPQLVVNDLTGVDSSLKETYEELRAQGMPLSKLNGQIIAPLVTGTSTTSRVSSVQVNFVSGGCLLVLYTSHTFVDANGATTILSIWSEKCREAQALPVARSARTDLLDSRRLPEALDGAEFKGRYSVLKDRRELWHLLGLHASSNLISQEIRDGTKTFNHIPAASAPPSEGENRVRSCIFSIDLTARKVLKQEASSPDNTVWISSSDAMVGLLWRSVMRARFGAGIGDAQMQQEDSIVTVAVDGRSILRPPISEAHLGNVVFCCMTRMSLRDLISPHVTLRQLAHNIRKSVNRDKDPQRLNDAIALASGIPDVSGLRIAFDDFMGRDLVTTSWVNLPVYEIDFGPIFGPSGKADFFRIPQGQFGGVCSFLPQRQDGEVEVIVTMLNQEMNRLRDDGEFGRYFRFKSE